MTDKPETKRIRVFRLPFAGNLFRCFRDFNDRECLICRACTGRSSIPGPRHRCAVLSNRIRFTLDFEPVRQANNLRYLRNPILHCGWDGY